MTKRRQESFGFLALSREAWNVRRVVHPGQQSYRRSFGVTERPDWSLGSSTAGLDRARDPGEPTHVSLHPFEKRAAGRYQRNVKAFVDVMRPLCRVISVRTHDDGPVAVNA